MNELKIDPEFRDKIPPLADAEFKQLEENIVSDGEIREPIITWNGTIIDGHHRWKIHQKHPEIPYNVKKMEFTDRWAAIVWICQNQMGRRNLTDEQKTYLIGKEYEAQKKTEGNSSSAREENGQFAQLPQNGEVGSKKYGTAYIVADAHGVGKNTVARAEHFSKGLDAADTVSPGFRESVLSGKIKAPKYAIASIAKMPEPEQKKAVESIKRGEKIKMPDDTKSSPYNLDDLKMELDAVVDTFQFNFSKSIEIHSYMLQDDAGKQKVIAALSEAETAIKKIKEML